MFVFHNLKLSPESNALEVAELKEEDVPVV